MLPCPNLDTPHLRALTSESIRSTEDADAHPPQTALCSCSPLTVLSQSVQGQLGTVIWSPLPPRPAAVVALSAPNTTALGRTPRTGRAQARALQCQEPIHGESSQWWERYMDPKPGELMLEQVETCSEQVEGHQQQTCLSNLYSDKKSCSQNIWEWLLNLREVKALEKADQQLQQPHQALACLCLWISFIQG